MKTIKLTISFFCCFFLLNFLAAQTKDSIPLKLRVGVYNVGHFNQGKLGGYQGEDAQKEMERWRKWIGQQSMDIFAVNEWNTGFDKDSVMNATAELLKPFYNNVYFGPVNRYIYNGIATNFKLTNIRIVNLTDKNYYATIGDLLIGQVTITIMSVHIPWQACCHESSVDALIDEMKKYEYLICAGDMNAHNKNQLKFFEAGFNIANGGYEGWHCTVAKNSWKEGSDKSHIDNIITSKNIKIMNVSAPKTGLTMEDHLPILADVVITWQ